MSKSECMNNGCILFFVKFPEPGKVKTRLAENIGEKTAAQLYKCFVADLLASLDKIKADIRICYSQETPLSRYQDWLGKDYIYLPQEGQTLGKKMESCFIESFCKNYDKTIIIGSDSPDLPDRILKEALEQLDNSQAVIGPSKDGGYYLLGFNKNDFLKEVFRNINWSTGAVFKETMKIFKEHNYRVYQLCQWHDIDTLSDLQNLIYRRKDSDNKSTTISYIKNNLNI